ncbi:MAG: 50S ribosomal protein L30 [Acidobacteria bacterium]|nr:50S ribosomal protein L30 [Acidobacteriota bacterium]
MATRTAQPKLLLEQYRSPIGSSRRQRRVLRSLGLRRIRQRVTKPDLPSVRGMIRAVSHLVRIVEAAVPKPAGVQPAARRRAAR